MIPTTLTVTIIITIMVTIMKITIIKITIVFIQVNTKEMILIAKLGIKLGNLRMIWIQIIRVIIIMLIMELIIIITKIMIIIIIRRRTAIKTKIVKFFLITNFLTLKVTMGML